jgi:hypothetical protein
LKEARGKRIRLTSPGTNKKIPRKRDLFILHQPHYFFPPLTLAMIKMINAMKATTKKMPHTIPALKMPEITEQLPKEKAKKQTNRKMNDLILFSRYFKSHTSFYANEIFNE